MFSNGFADRYKEADKSNLTGPIVQKVKDDAQHACYDEGNQFDGFDAFAFGRSQYRIHMSPRKFFIISI